MRAVELKGGGGHTEHSLSQASGVALMQVGVMSAGRLH